MVRPAYRHYIAACPRIATPSTWYSARRWGAIAQGPVALIAPPHGRVASFSPMRLACLRLADGDESSYIVIRIRVWSRWRRGPPTQAVAPGEKFLV